MSILSKTILAGLVATAAMTVLMIMAPMMGMPKMNIGAMLGGMMGMSATVGWVMHFIIGVIFALGYTYVIGNKLPIQSPLVRGMVYGFIVFVVAQVMMFIMGSMGMMPAPSGDATMAMIGSLMGHLVYGAVLGAMVGTVAASSHAHN